MNQYFAISSDSGLFADNTWYDFRASLDQQIRLDPAETYELSLLSAYFVDEYEDNYVQSLVTRAPAATVEIESLADELREAEGTSATSFVTPRRSVTRPVTAPTGRPLLKNLFPFLSCLVCDAIEHTQSDLVHWPILRWIPRPHLSYDTRTAAMLLDCHQSPEYHTVSVQTLHYFQFKIVGDFDSRLKTKPEDWPITTMLHLHLRQRS